jgi:hypothetical protein
MFHSLKIFTTSFESMRKHLRKWPFCFRLVSHKTQIDQEEPVVDVAIGTADARTFRGSGTDAAARADNDDGLAFQSALHGEVPVTVLC